MKSQIKRFSKSTLSVILSLCMLVSCMTVGIIATDAAYDNSEGLGVNSTVYFYNEDNWSSPYIWAWKSSDDTTNYTGDTWPGKALSSVSGKSKLFSYSLDTDAGMLIFSNNGSNQTSNIQAASSTWSDKIYDKGSGKWYAYSQYDYLYKSRNFTKTDRAAKGKIYFDNTATNWSGKIYFVVGRYSAMNNKYIKAYELTGLSGTKLYYKAINEWTGNDAAFYAVVASSSALNSTYTSGTGDKTYMDLISEPTVTNYSVPDNSDYNLNNDSSTYEITPTVSSGTNTIAFNYRDSGYSYFNSDQTIQARTYIGGTYANASVALGTLKINSANLTADGTSSGLADTSGSATSKSRSTAYTSTVTMSVSNVSSGYEFLGWGTANNAISQTGTGNYTYTASKSAKTIYAFFGQVSTNYDNIAVAAKGSTDGSTYNTTLSGTPATISATSYTTGTSALTITAGEVSGYSFAQWEVTAGSGTIGSATTASTTFTPSASNTTVTAQYKKNYTISKNSPTGGSVTLSNTSRVAGETFTVTISPDTGYVLSSLTVGGTDVTSSVSNNSYTGTASGSSDTINVVATFSEIPTTTIYVNKLLADGSFTHAHIWTTISGTNHNATGDWPGKQINSEWSLDSTHTDYYKLTFQKDGWTKFKIILSNNGSGQTTDSKEYNTGSTYYIDSATANSAAELKDGAPEIKYTVTVTTDGNGTVDDAATATVQAGSTGVQLPTPKGNYGYVFDRWEKVIGGVTITDVTSSTSTVTATAEGTVKAKFKPNENMNLFIAGRFHISNGSGGYINSFDANGWSDTGDENIQFVWDSEKQKYKVETGLSLAELSDDFTEGSTYFFVYDSTSKKYYYSETQDFFTDTNKEADLAEYANKSSNLDTHIKFDSTSNDSPVTIYYDATTKKLSYTTPVFYDVTVSPATGGTVTAKPARATEGSAITLEVEPNDHYRLESISAVQNGVSGALQLTETEDGYSFTMPAGNVTVTPSFTPTTYTNISYSARGSQSENAKTDYTDATYTEVLNASLGYSNSATYITGRGLTAPDYPGYAFYKWVATGGVFDKSPSAATPNESTSPTATFYPTQDGAQVKALYRYNYSLRITQPSNGTVSGTTTGYKAGDNYTLTITPNEGYMLDTLTVSNTDVTISANITETGYTYTGTASGTTNPITVAATFKQIEDTVIRVNKYINTHNYNNNSNDHLNGIHIWTRIGQNYYDLTHYPNESDPSYENFTEWDTDPDYPDYYTKSFKVHWGKIQLLFHLNGDAHKTNNSEELATGYQYYIDDLSSNTPVVTRGEPGYSIAGETGLVGGTDSWDTTLVANEMTNTNGTFTLNKTGVAKSKNVPKGDDQTGDYYEYKVVTNHNWNYGSYPAINQTIHVLYDNSNVNFTYRPSTQSLVATVSGGEFKAQTANVEHGTAVISTSSTVTGTDKSVTLSADKLYTEDNYRSGYTTKSVYVKVALDPHYEVTGWTDGNGADLTPANTPTVTHSGTPDTVGDTVIAQFSVDRDITIVPIIAKKVHTVTFTSDQVGGTVRVNSMPDSAQTAGSTWTCTIEEYDNYNAVIIPSDGYRITSVKINDVAQTITSDLGFTLTKRMGYVDEVLVVEFQRIGYQLRGTVSPEHGQVKFYSDAGCTQQINTASIGDTFYAKYIPEDGYVLKNFYIVPGTSTGTTKTSADAQDRANNTGTFTMGYGDVTIRADLMLQYDVKYYVDMHSTNMIGKTVQVAVVGSNGVLLKDKDDADCTGTLSQEGDTSVYSGSITTPLDTGTGTIGDLRLNITYNSNNYTAIIPAEKVNTLKSKATKEIWFETQNEPSYDLKYTNKTNSTPTVSSGERRIYLAKPVSRESDWTNIRLYYWSDNNINNGWDGDSLQNTHMNWLGQDETYHYYYFDIPKNDNQNNDKSKFNNFVFQGCSKNDDNDTWTAVKTQSDDIYDAPDSANYYILADSGKGITQGEDVVIPSYTQYREEVWMNVDVYDTFEPGSNQIVSIMPTYTGGKIIFDISNEDQAVVTVDENGKLTPHSSGIATINVKIFGTIGKALNDFNSNLTEDSINYDVTVHVSNPGNLSNFNVMAIESAVYTVTIPTVSSTQPAYFDMSKVEMVVEGIKGATKSNNSAIINYTGSSNISSFTVKYAKANSDFNGYDNIRITGTIVTDSVRYSGGARYGHKQWDPSPQGSTTTVKINNGVETATTKNFLFDKSAVSKTYQDIFETYEYVDVTFNFDYYEYVPKVEEDGMINYPYDAAWAGTEDRFNGGFIVKDGGNKEHHKLIQHQVTAYEVRGITKKKLYNAKITSDDLTILVNGAAAALGEMPSNNYYSYLIDKSSDVIPPGEIAEVVENQTTNDYAVSVNVHMKHKLNYYHVYVNGTEVQNEDTQSVSGKDQYGYTYQSYAEPTVQDASDWYAVDASTSDPHGKNASIDNAPLLATNDTGYKFRVKGDTYLRTQKASGDRKGYDFLRSEVDFSHYEITHRENSQDEIVDYLLQNFYIADFFSPSEVLDFNRPKTGSSNEYLPYDDAQFVGGGVVYFSVDSEGKPRSNNALALGYVNEDGTINEDAVKQMLRNNIEAQYDVDNVSGVLGEEDAMKVAYGTEIEAKQHVNAADGMKSGVLYRYLPLNQYKRDNSGILEKDENDKYTLAYEVNNNTFRYSNTLHSYQYVYASGNENKETNNGRNMRLYSYYVYSYVAYNQETNVPETKYEIVLSDNYSDASTYWAGNPNPNPAN